MIPNAARPGPVLVLDLNDDHLAADQPRVLHGNVLAGELLVGEARVFVPEPGVGISRDVELCLYHILDCLQHMSVEPK